MQQLGQRAQPVEMETHDLELLTAVKDEEQVQGDLKQQQLLPCGLPLLLV
jgi:hypothetical protein